MAATVSIVQYSAACTVRHMTSSYVAMRNTWLLMQKKLGQYIVAVYCMFTLIPQVPRVNKSMAFLNLGLCAMYLQTRCSYHVRVECSLFITDKEILIIHECFIPQIILVIQSWGRTAFFYLI